jgi:hypothetical protein
MDEIERFEGNKLKELTALEHLVPTCDQFETEFLDKKQTDLKECMARYDVHLLILDGPIPWKWQRQRLYS